MSNVNSKLIIVHLTLIPVSYTHLLSEKEGSFFHFYSVIAHESVIMKTITFVNILTRVSLSFDDQKHHHHPC